MFEFIQMHSFHLVFNTHEETIPVCNNKSVTGRVNFFEKGGRKVSSSNATFLHHELNNEVCVLDNAAIFSFYEQYFSLHPHLLEENGLYYNKLVESNFFFPRFEFEMWIPEGSLLRRNTDNLSEVTEAGKLSVTSTP